MKQPLSNLTGAQQAAVLVKYLPKGIAAKLVNQLQPADLQSLTRCLRDLPPITNSQIQTIVGNFSNGYQQPEKLKTTSNHQAAFKTTNVGTAAPLDPQNESPFDFLLTTSLSLRKRLFANEHPLNTALALSHLPTDFSAETLNSLEPESRVSVLRRLCEVENYDSQDIKNLSHILRSRIDKLANSQTFNEKGVEIASRMLSCADEESQSQILEHLESEAPELAYRLEESVFKFSELKSLSNADIKTLLANVDTSCWAPALKHSSLNLKKKILNNMASGPSDLLSEEISEIGPVDSQIASRAQQQILETCLDLQTSGQILLPGTCTIQLV